MVAERWWSRSAWGNTRARRLAASATVASTERSTTTAAIAFALWLTAALTSISFATAGWRDIDIGSVACIVGHKRRRRAVRWHRGAGNTALLLVGLVRLAGFRRLVWQR